MLVACLVAGLVPAHFSGPLAPRPAAADVATTTVDSGTLVFHSGSVNSFSADGRYLTYARGGRTVVYDRLRRTPPDRVDVASSGALPNPDRNSGWSSISGDGRFVVFDSDSVLVSEDTNDDTDTYLRDRVARTTTRVSVSSSGGQGTNLTGSAGPLQPVSITANGRYIAFQSNLTYLVPVANDSNNTWDVYLRDRVAGTTEVISASDGTQTAGDNSSLGGAPPISADGRYLAFISSATNLVAGDTNAKSDVFLRDRQTSTTTRLNVTPNGAQSSGDVGNVVTMSADGRYVAFTSTATDLGPASNGQQQVYLRDRVAGTTLVVSYLPGGSLAGTHVSSNAYLSPDGRYLTFSVGAMDGPASLYLRDLQAGATTMVATGGISGYRATVTNDAAEVLYLERLSPEFGAALYLRIYGNTYLPPPPPVGGPLTAAEVRGHGNPSEHCTPCVIRGEGDPINPATGNFSETFTDFAAPGRGAALALSRTYNSDAASQDGPFGYGWTHTYNVSLAIAPDESTVTAHQEGGSEVTFTKAGSSYTAAPRVTATLVKNANGTFTLTRRAREILDFDGSGKLTALRDLNGYSTVLAYSAGKLTTVTDPAGRTLTFTYSGNRISSLADSSTPARTVGFTYDGSGNLSDVTDVGGGNWHFTYDANHRMLTRRDSRAKTVTNHYDASGRVDWQDDELGRRTAFDYTSLRDATKVTDPKGNVRVYAYEHGLLTNEIAGYGTVSEATWSYQYDPATLGVTKMTDPAGEITTATYDTSGNLLTRSDPLNRTTTWTYNALNQPLTMRDPTGVTTTWTYDGAGNPLTDSKPLLDANGQTTATRTVTYGYGGTTPVYAGDITSITDPDGHTVQLRYDAYGNLVSKTDPPTPENAAGNMTTWSYDVQKGWVLSVVGPKGNLSGANPEDYRTTYAYDAFGRRTRVRDPLWSSATPTLHQQTWTYDGNGNVTSTTDGEGRTTTYVYDDANQLTTINRPDGTTTRFDYWPDRRVHRRYDGSNAETTYTYDAAGHPATVTDPLNRTTTVVSNAFGKPVTVTDALNRTITYGYDVAQQKTSISYSDPATPDVTAISYDGNGRRTSMTDGTGTSTWTWDSLGGLTRSTDGAGAQVSYGYNLRGLVTSIAYPGGVGSVARSYDAAGRLTSVEDWLGNVTSFGYDANTNQTTTIFPASTLGVDTATFDRADRLTGIDVKRGIVSLASFTYGRDGDDQLTSVVSTGVPTDTHAFGYSPLRQLTTVDSTSYRYDPADNLTKLTSAVFQNYDAANQLLSTGAGPTLVGTASAGDNGAASSLTIPLPAGTAASDQIVIGVILPHNKTVNTPTGYTVVGSFSSGTANSSAKLVVFRRTAATGDTSITISFVGKFAKAAAISVYRGVHPTNPIDVQSNGSTSGGTAVTAPAVAPTVAGERLVMFEGALTGGTAGSWSAPTGMTEQVERAGGSTTAVAISDQTLENKGGTGTRVATFSTSAQLVGVLVGLRPALTTYGYNAVGDRISVTPPSGSATTLSYDQASRLTSYGTTATYAYNGGGLRMRKTVSGTTTSSVYDLSRGLPLVLQETTGGTTTRYIYGPGGRVIASIVGSIVTYYHQDQLGSTRLLTDAAGNVAGSFTYDVYGKLVASTGTATTPIGFAGQYTDAESGFQYLRARYYDPGTAQFVTVDPAFHLTLSRYGYVQGNPLNFTDPTGLDDCGSDWNIGGLVDCLANPTEATNPVEDAWDSAYGSVSGAASVFRNDVCPVIADIAQDVAAWGSRVSGVASVVGLFAAAVGAEPVALVAFTVAGVANYVSVGASGVEMAMGIIGGETDHIVSGGTTFVITGMSTALWGTVATQGGKVAAAGMQFLDTIIGEVMTQAMP